MLVLVSVRGKLVVSSIFSLSVRHVCFLLINNLLLEGRPLSFIIKIVVVEESTGAHQTN